MLNAGLQRQRRQSDQLVLQFGICPAPLRNLASRLPTQSLRSRNGDAYGGSPELWIRLLHRRTHTTTPLGDSPSECSRVEMVTVYSQMRGDLGVKQICPQYSPLSLMLQGREGDRCEGASILEARHLLLTS